MKVEIRLKVLRVYFFRENNMSPHENFRFSARKSLIQPVTKSLQLPLKINFRPWKMPPVKNNFHPWKITAKLHYRKRNLSAYPSRPHARIFRKHHRQKARFSKQLCRRYPLGQLNIKINLEERPNFSRKTHSPSSRRTQNSQKWKTQTRINSLNS